MPKNMKRNQTAGKKFVSQVQDMQADVIQDSDDE